MMLIIPRLPKVILLTPDELRLRRQALTYIALKLSMPEWHRDSTARWLLIRERDHVLNEIIQGCYLPSEREME